MAKKKNKVPNDQIIENIKANRGRGIHDKKTMPKRRDKPKK